MMSDRILYWASVVFGVLGLILVVTNISMISSNRSLQAQISERQSIISKGVTLSQINQSLVQALADVAVRKNDPAVRDLLAAQGITIKSNAPDADATKSPSAPTSKKKK